MTDLLRVMTCPYCGHEHEKSRSYFRRTSEIETWCKNGDCGRWFRARCVFAYWFRAWAIEGE